MHEFDKALHSDRQRRVFRVTVAQRSVGLDEGHPRPAMRDDLMQQRRDRDHRALGRKPKAAQGLEVLDRAHSTPSDDGKHTQLRPKVLPKIGEARTENYSSRNRGPCNSTAMLFGICGSRQHPPWRSLLQGNDVLTQRAIPVRDHACSCSRDRGAATHSAHRRADQPVSFLLILAPSITRMARKQRIVMRRIRARLGQDFP
jgi:hypothetical protein